MAGVRVQHPTHRNARFTVAESDRPYSTPYQCTPPEFGGCGSVHTFKTHHLNLDETGSVIIGDVLFKKIRHLLVLAGFVESNEVKRPPSLSVGIAPRSAGSGAWGNVPIIHEGDSRG